MKNAIFVVIVLAVGALISRPGGTRSQSGDGRITMESAIGEVSPVPAPDLDVERQEFT